MSAADEIEKLNNLKKEGAISEEEFERAKAALLEKNQSGGFEKAMGNIAANENSWSMLMHLSQFLNFIIPLSGLIVPIVLWQMKKNESEFIDRNGKIITNWLISGVIYSVVCLVLIVVLIGIPMLVVLGILSIVFPVIGAIKANNGEAWSYPLSIKFLKLD